MFDRDRFQADLLVYANLGLGKERPLSSGRTSSIYIDCRPLSASVQRLLMVYEHISQFLIDCYEESPPRLQPSTHTIAVPDGTTLLAAVYNTVAGLYADHDIPLTLIRKQPKQHGTQATSHLLGSTEGRPLLLEDVVSTSASVLNALDLLETYTNIHPVGVLCLVDRMHRLENGETARQRIEARGYPFCALTTLKELLPGMIHKEQPSKESLEKVRAELLQHHYGFEDFDFEPYFQEGQA